MAASSVGAVSDRGYQLPPMPVGPYNIPFGAVEPLSATFRMWTRDWGRLVLLAAIPLLFTIPLAVGAGLVAFFAMQNNSTPSLGTMIALGGLGFVAFLVLMLSYLASFSAMIVTVDERERTGQNETGAWQAFLHGLSKCGRLFVITLPLALVWTVEFCFLFAPMFVSIFDRGGGNDALMMLLIPGLVLFPVCAYLTLRLMPLMTVGILEDIPLGETFSRTLALTRGNALNLFLGWILYFLVVFGISMAGGIVGLIPIVGFFVQIAVNLVTTSLAAVWMFAIYASLVTQQK